MASKVDLQISIWWIHVDGATALPWINCIKFKVRFGFEKFFWKAPHIVIVGKVVSKLPLSTR